VTIRDLGFHADINAMFRPRRFPTMVTPRCPIVAAAAVYFINDLSLERLAQHRAECQ
jgi:hypothetical protein